MHLDQPCSWLCQLISHLISHAHGWDSDAYPAAHSAASALPAVSSLLGRPGPKASPAISRPTLLAAPTRQPLTEYCPTSPPGLQPQTQHPSHPSKAAARDEEGSSHTPMKAGGPGGQARGGCRPGLKAKVAVPRLNGGRLGVLATRSPHRPCPIGLSVAKDSASKVPPVQLDVGRPGLPLCLVLTPQAGPSSVLAHPIATGLGSGEKHSTAGLLQSRAGGTARDVAHESMPISHAGQRGPGVHDWCCLAGLMAGVVLSTSLGSVLAAPCGRCAGDCGGGAQRAAGRH
ncbi:TsaA-like domain-containing protein [Haematococcus lacustris]|uniref:TsaA-like domain-containing protein n=1 Tax=Haematococcus lacustris TaxID=44745 RepID=A0A699ZAS6_HAELA|nr:TsaA-like domain-containing protein [Haematococcus lacustris]